MKVRPELPEPLEKALQAFFSPPRDSILDLYARLKTYQLLSHEGAYERQARKLGINEGQLVSLLEWVRAQKQAFDSHVVDKLYCDQAFLRRLLKAHELTRSGKLQSRKSSAREIVAFHVYTWWKSRAPFPTASEFYDLLPKDITLDRHAFRLILRQLGVASWFRSAQRGRPPKKRSN
jgi:hypothetical protein